MGEDGTYLPGASVTLTYGRELRHLQQGRTDETGQFHLKEVRQESPPGGFMRITYPPGTGVPSMLEVKADGYEPVRLRFIEDTQVFIPDAETGRHGGTIFPVRWQYCGKNSVWIGPVVLSRHPVATRSSGN
jgi:hypothetical protein